MYFPFLLTGLNDGLEQEEDACEFQDGGEPVDTGGVSVLFMHPSQTLCHHALHP